MGSEAYIWRFTVIAALIFARISVEASAAQALAGDRTGKGFIAVLSDSMFAGMPENPATLPLPGHLALNIHHFVPHNLSDVSATQVSGTVRAGRYVVGSAIAASGFDAFQQIRLRALLRRRGRISLGVSTGLDFLKLGQLGTTRLPTWSMGLAGRLTQRLYAGAYAACSSRCTASIAPEIVGQGLAFKASDLLTLSFDHTAAGTSPKTESRIGIMIQPSTTVLLWTTINPARSIFDAGAVLTVRNLQFQVLISQHPDLGLSRGIALGAWL